jgi:hypothetical protein
MTLNKSFFALTGAFLAMSTAAISLVVGLIVDSIGPAPFIVALGAALVAAVLLWSEARRDVDAVLTLIAAFALLTGICLGIYVYSAREPGLAPEVSTVAAALTAAVLGFLTYRRQHRESPDFPDVLGRQFGPTRILETDGVQFTGTLQPGQGGSPHFATIFLQNTFNGSRSVTITFDAAGEAQYLRFYPEQRLTLGPAEVSAVTVPVVAPTYPGQYSLYFSLGVAGEEGGRVRLRRARTASDRVKASTTAALLAVGHLTVGGGVRFTIGPLPEDIWAIDLPAPTVKSLWQPQFGTIPSRQSAADA